MKLKKRGTRPGDGRKLDTVQRKILATYDNLQFWLNDTIIEGVRLKAKEAHFRRGKDGLTVKFLKGDRVLATYGPYKRYKDRAIPRLKEMAKIGPEKEGNRLTGKFGAIVDSDAWACRVTWTKTRSGENLVLRFTGSKPWKGFK